jgi:hypothetical protein
MMHSRLRWARLNRDKDVSKMPRVTNSKRKNPKRKSKRPGTKTREADSDSKSVVQDSDTAKDKDLKSN